MGEIANKICKDIDFSVVAIFLFIIFVTAFGGIGAYLDKCHEDNVKIEMAKAGMEQRVVGDKTIWVKAEKTQLEAK